MAFIKFLWGLLINLDLLLQGAMLLGLILWMTRWRKVGQRLIVIGLVPFLIISLTPFSRWMLGDLETHISSQKDIPSNAKGLILLGGPISLAETAERGAAVYNKTVGRVSDFIMLAHRYPKLPIIVTGTSLEAKHIAHLLTQSGIDSKRLILENASRNTRDNAYKSYDLVHPGSSDLWVLVTSAHHMPRAVGLFEGAGWNVFPYPVDYQTSTHKSWASWLYGLDRLNTLAFSTLMLQWAGMINQYLEGDSKYILPPQS